MRALSAPGLYAEPATPVRGSGRLSRGDVAVFLGYARRGPVDMPVRVESLTLAEEIFGPPLDGGYLNAGLKGFFENGGHTAYVIRLASAGARAAEVAVGGHWVARASFGWSLIDPRERKRGIRPDEATWVQLVETVFRETGPRSPAPGVWGNGLEVRVLRTQRARSRSVPGSSTDPRLLPLTSLAGIEPCSVLELGQTRDGVTRIARVIAAGIDPLTQAVRLPVPLSDLVPVADPAGAGAGAGGVGGAGFAPDLPVQVTSVEFDIEIWSLGRLEQAFRALSPHPRHPAPIAATLEMAGRSVSLLPEGLGADADWTNPDLWPQEGAFALSGGRDGLDAIGLSDWLRGLRRIADLDEVALIAAPDLMLQPQALPPAEMLPAAAPDCCDPAAHAAGKLLVEIRGVEAGADGGPLPRVDVDVLGAGRRLRSDHDGMLRATGVPTGLLTLRLSREGYEPAEAVVQAERFLPARPVTLSMTRIVLPRALPQADIVSVLAALADPAEVGPYKVAIVDPPDPRAGLDEIRAWRARLGDTNRLAFFAPWLRLPSTDAAGQGGVVPCPPSGHVCGVFAQAERAVGIHRSGANLPLRLAEGVMLDIDEAAAAVLNPAGINAIRSFAGRGIRVYGTRTLSAAPEWRYLTARRVVDAIQKTLERGLHWTVFEPNGLMTRHAAAQSARVLLGRLWRDGVLAGSAPDEAFSVKCDLENNPEDGVEAGRLVIDIGVAPTTPFEFVLFRLGNAFDALKVTEEMP